MKIWNSIVALGFASLATACASSVPAPAPPQSVASNPPAAAAAKPKASAESLEIAFDPAKAVLSDEANAQLDGAARLYRDAQPEVMIVSGHTDKDGNEFTNLILAARRAEAVKRGLVDRGVPADRLQIVAIGEAEPVPTVVASRSAIITWR